MFTNNIHLAPVALFLIDSYVKIYSLICVCPLCVMLLNLIKLTRTVTLYVGV